MLLDCPPELDEVALPHRCRGTEADAPIPYRLGPGGRARLAEGETLPVTARCRRCGGRAFASLVDPAARARRLAEVRPDPTALRPPSPHAERVRRFAGAGAPPRSNGPGSRPAPRLPARVAADPCPACGQVPDAFGHCRCSA